MLALWLSNTLSAVKKKLIKTCKKGEGRPTNFIWDMRLDFSKPWTLIYTCTRNEDTKSKFSIQFPWWYHFSPHLNILLKKTIWRTRWIGHISDSFLWLNWGKSMWGKSRLRATQGKRGAHCPSFSPSKKKPACRLSSYMKGRARD